MLERGCMSRHGGVVERLGCAGYWSELILARLSTERRLARGVA